MGKQKKATTMTDIKVEGNISDYLDSIDREVQRVADRYKLPRKDKMPPEGIIAFAMFSGSLDQLIQEKGHLPFDLMQACYISQYLADAREQLLNSDAAKFGYSIASIFVIIAKKQREIARQAGKGRKGYEGPFTLFIKDVIKFTQKKNPKCTAKHVIKNIDIIYIKNKMKYFPQLILWESDDEYKYIENGNNPGSVKLRSLIVKINALKKSPK